MNVALPKWWPEETVECYQDLVSYRLVGASACADRITETMVRLAVTAQAERRDVFAEVTLAGRRFCALKPDTALYVNTVDLMAEASRKGRAEDVVERADALARYRHQARMQVVDHAVSVLDEAETLLVHDYSSMVVRIVAELGGKRARRVVVTAGEPLGQGERVAELVAASGHRVVYIPDMSAARVIGGVDAFVTGVESFYADGSMANTVGTVMLGLLCRENNVSVIAPAECLKYDRQRSSVKSADLTARLLHPWPSSEPRQRRGWSVEDRVLDSVPGELISAYVTEVGVCGADEIGQIARSAIARVVH
jgi:ribose 1,5-bisphosphate isomerase